MKLSPKRLFYKRNSSLAREVFDLRFPNPVGLCAGSEKGSEKYNSSSNLRFGYVEIGPFTPRPQESTQQRRFFRKDTSVNINKGIRHIISKIQQNSPDMLLSVAISHNDSSSDEDSIIKDYLYSFSMIYDFADIIAIDAAITNSDGSKPFQDPSLLEDVLDTILEMRLYYDKHKPIILKISDSLSSDILDEIIGYCQYSGIDAICVHDGKNAVKAIKTINETSKSRLPIIVEASNISPDNAAALYNAGACLIQTTKGKLRRGNRYAGRIIKAIEKSSVK